jgi:hypothetical protein
MLDKHSRKKLSERTWLDIKKSDPNPYVTLRRWKDQANRAINDLTLIAQKLPDDTLKDIFNYTNIRKVVSAILRENEFAVRNSATVDDVRRIQLAAVLVEIGITTCINEYGSKIEQDSVLNELTINHLSRARDICDAISFKMRLPQIEEEAKREDLVCLFNWNRIEEVHEINAYRLKSEDTKKFVNFLQDICIGEVGVAIEVINTISFDPQSSDPHFFGIPALMIFRFTDFYGDHGEGTAWLNFEEKTARIAIKTSDGTQKLRNDLVIKLKNENAFVYKKGRSAPKLVKLSRE